MELNAPETFDESTNDIHPELPSLHFPQQISLDLKRVNALKHQEEKLSLIRTGTILLNPWRNIKHPPHIPSRMECLKHLSSIELLHINEKHRLSQ